MLDQKDILSTLDMIDNQHLDIRTITMGISLLDCADSDLTACCEKIYNKITRCAKDLVKVGEEIEAEFGIPIVNKRISVTPISLVAAMWRLPRPWMPRQRNAASISSAAFPLWCRRALRKATGS